LISCLIPKPKLAMVATSAHPTQTNATETSSKTFSRHLLPFHPISLTHYSLDSHHETIALFIRRDVRHLLVTLLRCFSPLTFGVNQLLGCPFQANRLFLEQLQHRQCSLQVDCNYELSVLFSRSRAGLRPLWFCSCCISTVQALC
jgi:hypothetical protein